MSRWLARWASRIESGFPGSNRLFVVGLGPILVPREERVDLGLSLFELGDHELCLGNSVSVIKVEVVVEQPAKTYRPLDQRHELHPVFVVVCAHSSVSSQGRGSGEGCRRATVFGSSRLCGLKRSLVASIA